MNCPYCNTEMEPGYIQSRDGVEWTSKKKMVAALPSFSGKVVPLSDNGMYSGQTAIAYNCPNCKKIIIDYDSAN